MYWMLEFSVAIHLGRRDYVPAIEVLFELSTESSVYLLYACMDVPSHCSVCTAWASGTPL